MCVCVSVGVHTYIYTHTYVHIHTHIHIYMEKILLITNKILFSVSKTKTKKEKGDAPKSAKWLKQTTFCIFCQQKNQSWHLPSKMICTQDCWWPCEKKRGSSPCMCHPVALRTLPAFLRESGGHHNVMTLSFTPWRKKAVVCPSTQKRQMHCLFKGYKIVIIPCFFLAQSTFYLILGKYLTAH